MEKEFTEVYCGGGKGKTTLAIGQCLRASTQGKSVIIIQFLKGRERRELDFLEDLDNLDIKIFRFEKHDECYEELNEQEKAEEKTKSGIILPDSAKEQPQEAVVVAVGPGKEVDGKKIEMQVKEGDKVIYSKYAGTEVKMEEEEYIIVGQDDIIAIVE